MVKPNILVVEDEELMRTILRKILEDAGYQIKTADSAENALEIFTNSEIDITLTDIRMVGMDGLELLDQIKTIEPEALVIIMTAYSSVDSAIAALRKGLMIMSQNLLSTKIYCRPSKMLCANVNCFKKIVHCAANSINITVFRKLSEIPRQCNRFFG